MRLSKMILSVAILMSAYATSAFAVECNAERKDKIAFGPKIVTTNTIGTSTSSSGTVSVKGTN